MVQTKRALARARVVGVGVTLLAAPGPTAARWRPPPATGCGYTHALSPRVHTESNVVIGSHVVARDSKDTMMW